jgi:DNA polymerase-3 subunit chi
MGEIRFYRLGEEGVDGTLPLLLERVLARGQRALVRVGAEEALPRLDARLWTYAQGSFLPHGIKGGPHDPDQPVLLTTDTGDNGADVLFLTDGARVNPAEADDFAMIVRLFEERDEEAVAVARQDWRAVTEAQKEAVFWAREDGKWVEKARSSASAS